MLAESCYLGFVDSLRVVWILLGVLLLGVCLVVLLGTLVLICKKAVLGRPALFSVRGIIAAY